MHVTFGGETGDRAYACVREILHPAILNHSVRVWLLADHLARRQDLKKTEREALAVACLFHDSGTAAPHDGAQRFEVEGADAARAFLTDHGWSEDLGRQVWEAVALHTSPGIAERMGTQPRLVRLAVLADFGRTDLIGPEGRAELTEALERLPRLDIETALADAVVVQALRNPEKAPPSSWPGGLLAAHLANPDRTGGGNPAF
ncbi:HD domain-containing protein [Streptomyces pseudogriseolus]|uniref:HD domain-containing protein n=1 Tax=Streptomyces pseudogriseolus TaxID=36817 RepID=UPI003FA31502|nr:HD domain-containing protein [Streptomyces pseudogriseolus]